MFHIEYGGGDKKLPIPSPNSSPYKYDKDDVDRSNSITYLADMIGVSPLSLNKMQNGRWADILYPRILLAAYHLTLSMTRLISEDTCDKFIQDFMSKQDPIKYAELYQSAINDGVKKLVAARVLCASFGRYGGSKLNNLPQYMKYGVCEFLKVDNGISFNQSCNLIERLSKEVDHETLILGRIGYLMMWKSWSGVAGANGYFCKLLT